MSHDQLSFKLYSFFIDNCRNIEREMRDEGDLYVKMMMDEQMEANLRLHHLQEVEEVAEGHHNTIIYATL